jgi:hypothetical protein
MVFVIWSLAQVTGALVELNVALVPFVYLTVSVLPEYVLDETVNAANAFNEKNKTAKNIINFFINFIS